MEQAITSKELLNPRPQFKRQFSLKEIYNGTVFAPRAMSNQIKNNRTKIVDKNFLKRLELTVTEVNGCAVCSYAHTKMALRQGMGNEEISSFLNGEANFIQAKEAKAILFAQHFAESKGFPKLYAYNAIIKEYGKDKAKIMLTALQVMIVGNMYGIPMSAFISRLKGAPFKGSSLFYELKCK